MSGKNLFRRLERLEAELAPAEEEVLTLVVTEMHDDGEPMTTKTSELRFPKPPNRRRGWSMWRDQR